MKISSFYVVMLTTEYNILLFTQILLAYDNCIYFEISNEIDKLKSYLYSKAKSKIKLKLRILTVIFCVIAYSETILRLICDFIIFLKSYIYARELKTEEKQIERNEFTSSVMR